MGKIYTVVVGVLLVLGFVNANAVSNAQAKMAPEKTIKSQFKSPIEEASYAIGADIGLSLKQQLPNLDANTLQKGVIDAFQGKNLLMTREEIDQAIAVLQKQLTEKQEAILKEASEMNAKQSGEFLANNKTQKGVNTLPSGLQYKVVKSGSGATPKADDTVTVDYEGKLIDGTVFDSSYQRGQPASFKVSQVIAGWQQALEKMKVGDVWEVYIPPELAYGSEGVGPIGPNATLIFKVHLQGVNATPSQPN